MYAVKCVRVLRCQYSQVCVCARVCARRASFYFDISSSPSELLLSPFPQLRHNNVSTTLPPVLPFDSQGLSTDHHQKARQGVKKKKVQHTHTHTLLLKSMDQCVQSRTGGGRAEEDNDE